MIKSSDGKLKLFLFVLAFVIYANTLGHSYAWDDKIVILENPGVQKGFSGIPGLFIKSHSQYIYDKYGYRPVALTTFAIEYGLFRGKPAAGHLINVLLFSLLCVVLFSVLRRLFFQFGSLGPFLITVLFAVHPIHVEAVANIKSRDEILALLFSLLSLSAFIKYYTQQNIRQLILAFVLFVLAFLSKESAATFLLVMPLTLLYLGQGANLRRLVKPIAFVALILLTCVIILKLSSSGSYGKELSEGAGIYHESGILGNSFFYSDKVPEKVANAFTILLLYLKNFFYPVILVYFYGYNQVPVANLAQPLVIASIAIHLALLLFALLRFKKHKELSYGISFYFITISIYTHLFRTLADTMADRFLFTPSMGLCIAVVFALAALFKVDLHNQNVDRTFTNSNSAAKKMIYFFAVPLLLLTGRTIARNSVWKNNATLINHDMPYLENCARAHNYCADELKLKLLNGPFDSNTEAVMINHYKRSIEISKESYYAYLGLGSYLCQAKRYDEGIAVFDSAFHHFPNQADPPYYLGQALSETGKYPEAISLLETSLRLAPKVFITYYTLSIAYARSGAFDKALAIIDKARKEFPETMQLYEALGNIYYEKGDLELSAKNTLEMLRFGANPKNVYGIVIGRFQMKKQDSLAAQYYRQAIAQGVFSPGGR